MQLVKNILNKNTINVLGKIYIDLHCFLYSLGHFRPLLQIFLFFSSNLLIKNCTLQRDLNLNRQSLNATRQSTTTTPKYLQDGLSLCNTYIITFFYFIFFLFFIILLLYIKIIALYRGSSQFTLLSF